MPGKTRAKTGRGPKGLDYDNLVAIPFAPVTITASSPANTTIQAAIALAGTFKVFRIETVVFGTVTNTTSFNVVYGFGAEGSTPTDDTFDTTGVVNINGPTSNVKLLSADQALSTTSGTTQEWNPAVPEAMFGGKGSFTLRLAGTTVTVTVQVTLFGKFTDANITDPAAQTTAGGAPHTFNSGTDPL